MYKVTGGDGREYGPITADQVRQWLAEGRVNAGTPLKVEGGDWKPLYQFTEFAAALANSRTNPPPTPGTIKSAAGYSTAPARTSAMAIVSLVLGILTIPTCGLGGLVGIALGIVSLFKIKKSNGQLGGSGLAIAGICVSGIFLLILPVLLLPALAKAKQRAQSFACRNNGQQVGLGIISYAQSNNGQLPPAATWSDAISNQVVNTSVFQCPTRPGQQCSFAFNAALSGRKLGQMNPQTVMLFESDAGWNGSGGMGLVASHGHSLSSRSREPAVVVVHVDGSVALVPQSKLAFEPWQP